jgi:hypothetical protein
MKSRTVVVKEKSGLTLAQLADFVSTARNDGVSDSAVVGARVTWGRKLMEVSVEVKT